MIFRNNFKIDIEQIHHLIMLSENLRFEDDKADLRSVQHDLGATPCGLIRKTLFDQETLRVRILGDLCPKVIVLSDFFGKTITN